MDFSWTEDQELFRQTVREFAQKKITPIVREMDTKGEIPRDVIKGMAELGLLAITVPEEYGGAGADFVTAAIAAEELARADISIAIPVYYLVEASWAHVFAKYGTEEAKEEILPKVTSGELFFGIATTEPAGGSDIVGATRTTIKKQGDKWVINGEKVYISGVAESEKYGGVYITLAKNDPSKGHKGMTFAIVPIKDTPGIETTLFEDMGRMGVSTGGFSMDNVEIPDSYIVGEVGKGFYYAMEGFSKARVLIGATCLGAADAGLKLGIDYVKQRKLFGRPIGAFEGIQFPLAEDYTMLEADRLLTYKAAWLMDKMEAGEASPFEVALATAMAKLRAPIDALKILNDVADWHGAYGYTKECPVEMGVRGVRSYSIGAEGAPNIMRIIIAREVLGKEYLPYRQPPQQV